MAAVLAVIGPGTITSHSSWPFRYESAWGAGLLNIHASQTQVLATSSVLSSTSVVLSREVRGIPVYSKDNWALHQEHFNIRKCHSILAATWCGGKSFFGLQTVWDQDAQRHCDGWRAKGSPEQLRKSIRSPRNRPCQALHLKYGVCHLIGRLPTNGPPMGRLVDVSSTILIHTHMSGRVASF